MAASRTAVHVDNISPSTSDKEVQDFFSFCGKIANIQIATVGDTKAADVVFEKATAMKTALLLNKTQLGPNHIVVSSAGGGGDDGGPHSSATGERDSDELTQEEKPRVRILAEYLAHGYVVGDAAIKHAIDLDAEHGVSKRFVATLQQLDQKYHASDRAKATDVNYGISQRANSLLCGVSSYFEKAGNTLTGKKLVKFYTESTRQVQEVHAEARRLAELKKNEFGGSAYKAAGLDKIFGKEKEGQPQQPQQQQTGTAAAVAESGTEMGAVTGTGTGHEKA